MALLLLRTPVMPEPDDKSHEHDHVEHRVVYETTSGSTTRSSAITIVIVVVIALVLIGWIVMQMR